MCQNKTDSQKPFFGACAKVHAHATSMTTACRPASVVRGAFYILREEAPHGWPQSNRETLTICGRDLSRAARGKGSAPAFGASPSLRSPALHVLRTRSRPPFPPLGENVSALTGDDRFCNRLPPLRLLLVVDKVYFGFRRQVWSLPRRHRGRTTGFAPELTFVGARNHPVVDYPPSDGRRSANRE